MRLQAVRLLVSLSTFLLGIAATNLFGFLPFSKTSYAGAEQDVMKVEQQYVRAHLERDVVALEQVLADDFTSFRGRVKKEHRLAMLANPLFTVTSFSTEDVSVAVEGDEAWVRGHARLSGSFHNREFTTPRYRYTRRLELRDGRWQIVQCKFSFRR